MATISSEVIAYLVLSFGLLNLSLAIYSIRKIRQDKDRVKFIWWWAFINGSFVWEDMLIFGSLHFGFALASFLASNPILWVVCFLMFWIVRSAGETLYFFLQQFIQPQHHPHYISSHFAILRKLFGELSDQKCFIIMQVTMQSILVISSVSLILILKTF